MTNLLFTLLEVLLSATLGIMFIHNIYKKTITQYFLSPSFMKTK